MLKKLFALTLVTTLTLQPLTVGAFFGGTQGGIGSAGPVGPVNEQINEFIENYLNINTQESLQPLTEFVNVAGTKSGFPQVESISFNPPNPRPGEKVTATAHVKGITNPDTAYYTWYIRRGGEGNDFVKMRDDAARLLVDNARTHHRLLWDQPANGGNGNGVVEIGEFPADTDNDGFKASLGGADQRNTGTNYCYMYDKISGISYELAEHEGKESEFSCAEDMVPICLRDSVRTCNAKVANSFSEDNPTGAVDISSYAVDPTILPPPWARGNIKATPIVGPIVRTDIEICEDAGRPYCGRTIPNGNEFVPVCPEGAFPKCVAKNILDNLISHEENSCAALYVGLETPPSKPWVAPEIPYDDSCTAKDRTKSKLLEQFSTDIECSEGLVNEDDAVKNLCDFDGDPEGIHLFPHGGGVTGDGDFGVEEEFYWGANPQDGALNEKLIAGVGQKTFTWHYQEGDELGVVVEGMGLVPTKHDDASYQTVFAFMPGGCEPKNRGTYVESVNGRDLTIHTANMLREDIEKCFDPDLKEGDYDYSHNFVAPGISEVPSIQVSVQSNTPAPIFVNQGLTPSITAVAGFAANTDDPSVHVGNDAAHIRWQVEMSQNANVTPSDLGKATYDLPENNWQDITGQLQTAKGRTAGTNLNQFEFGLPSGIIGAGSSGYIRILAHVTLPHTAGQTQYGLGELVLPLVDTGSRLKISRTTSDGNTSSSAEEICAGGLDGSVCSATRNEVVALALDGPFADVSNEHVSWSVDGAEASCDATSFPECAPGAAPATIFVPVVGGKDGDSFTVVANVSDPSRGHDRITKLSRVVQLAEPSIKLVGVSGVHGVNEGTITTADGSYDAISTSAFIADSDTMTMEVQCSPTFICDHARISWSLLGGGVDPRDNPIATGRVGTFSFEGDNATVAAEAVVERSEEEAVFLHKAFNQKLTRLHDYHVTTTGTITKEQSITDFYEATGYGTPTFSATVAQNAPAYFLFLLKIILTIGVMLFVSVIVIGFSPRVER